MCVCVSSFQTNHARHFGEYTPPNLDSPHCAHVVCVPDWTHLQEGCVCVHVMCRRCTEVGGPSGFGFELTFRLRREPGETAPPTWPATLLQALARYVFQSGQYAIYQPF